MNDRHSALRLAIFNHKGGVGKTTLTVNLGAALTEAGKVVLLVDSDPQCNLTSYLIEDTVVDSLLDGSDGARGRTVWSALKPVVEAKGDVKEVASYETSTERLYVLPGDIRLCEFELELADYWTAAIDGKVKGFGGTTALSRLANNCATEIGADFVFYDTGPNIGPLNRAILLDCDFFIVPGACDLFSVRALTTLGHTLCDWVVKWEKRVDAAPDGVPLLRGRPRFLGYIPQGFRVYGKGMARWPSRYRAKFEKRLFSDLMKPLSELGEDLAGTNVSAAKLGEVKDFATLVQQSQGQGVPLWEVYGGQGYQMEQARKTFVGIAENVIRETLAYVG